MTAETLDRAAPSIYLDRIKSILLHAVQDRPCEVYLFGSRATGDNLPASDFDIAVLASDDISRELSMAREMLEESNIPFKVDLVDLRFASPAFSRQVQLQGILLWKN